MAKYKILKDFRDIKTKEQYKANQEIEMTVKRAEEVEENLKERGGGYVERIYEEEVE